MSMSETEVILAVESLTLQELNVETPLVDDAEKACKSDSFSFELEMPNNIEVEACKSIGLLGYQGPLLSENDFKKALEEGPKSVEFTKLVNFLTNELRVLCNLDECVNAITAPEDSVSFIMETSSFLNELGCPYPSLTQGHVSDRLSTMEDRVVLIEHLATELMAARILRENRPEKKIELKLKESSHAADLRKICQTLGFPKPPANITMQTLMQKLIPVLQISLNKANAELLSSPMLNTTLTEKQWEILFKIQQELHDDYKIRREMLLKRLDCTIQSFQWSDKTKGKDAQIDKAYTEHRMLLKAEPDVDVADLVAAREDLAIIEKTSSASVRKNTKSSINRVIIGQVPDRGGRTSEQAPPPPEMPPWLQRSAGPSGGGGGPRGQRGGQSNRGGSNYSRGGAQQASYRGGGGGGNYSQGGGGGNYSQGGGGGNYSQGGGSYQSGGNYQGGGGYDQGGKYSQSGGNRGDYNTYSGDSRGGSKAFDSAGSYGGDSRGDQLRGSSGNNNYARNDRGNNDYSRNDRGSNDYSRGSDYSGSRGGGSYSQGNGGYSQNSGGYSQGSQSSYSQGSQSSYSQGGGGYSRGGGGGGFDSAGSYGGYSQDYQEPKRAKTYDQFQQSKSTYADQYVQESQQNQQYHSRDRDNRNRGRGGGGRSNYNRGGGSYR